MDRVQVSIGAFDPVFPNATLQEIAEIAEAAASTLTPDEFSIVRGIIIGSVCRIAQRCESGLARRLWKANCRMALAGDCDLGQALRDLVGVDKPRAMDARVLLALDFIRRRYDEPALDVTAVAEHVRISRWHLARLLRVHTGQCFTAHLGRRRLAEAVGLLVSPLLSIKEVAARVGYRDADAFTREFRETYGVTPRKWRLAASQGGF